MPTKCARKSSRPTRRVDVSKSRTVADGGQINLNDIRYGSKRITPGSALQRLVADWLVARHIRVKRNNVGVAKHGDRFIPYGEKGESDLTARIPSKHPRLFYIANLEIKAGKDRQSYEQKIWQQAVEASGEYYVIVRKLEDVINFIEELTA
jgi:hypothetical protein